MLRLVFVGVIFLGMLGACTQPVIQSPQSSQSPESPQRLAIAPAEPVIPESVIAHAKTRAPLDEVCAPIKSWYEDPIAINGRPRTMGAEPHSGFDMAAKIGTAVIAAAPGTVVFSNYQVTSGSVIWIDHGKDADGNHIYSCSAHLSLRIAKRGDKVRRGDVIGRSGGSGLGVGKEGPHLHFGVAVRSAEQMRSEPLSGDIESLLQSHPVSPNFFLYPVDYANRKRISPRYFPKWIPNQDYGEGGWQEKKIFAGFTFPVLCSSL